MSRRVQASIGLSFDQLSPVPGNDGKWHHIASRHFEGYFAFHIKGFVDENGVSSDSPYFAAEGAKNATWCIQVQGMSSDAKILLVP